MKHVVDRHRDGGITTFDSETMAYTRTYSTWRLCAVENDYSYLVCGYFGHDTSQLSATATIAALSLAYGISVISDATPEFIRAARFLTSNHRDERRFEVAESCIYLLFDKHNFTKLCMLTDVKIIGFDVHTLILFTVLQDHLRGYTSLP